MSIDLQQELGLNVPTHEDNPISRKAAYVEAMQEHSLGKNLKGEDVKLTEKQAKYLYDQSLTAKTGINNNYFKTGKFDGEYASAYKSFVADVKRNNGQYTYRPGGDTGNGLGMSGHMNASRGSLLASGFGDSAMLMKEGMQNSLGFTTAQQRRQYETGGFLSKDMTIGTVGMNSYNIISTGIYGGDMYDALSDNLSAAGGMAGFHMGSKFGGAVFGNSNSISKVGRFVASTAGGALGGVIGSQAVSAVTSTLGDLWSNDSKLAKASKGFSQLSGATASVEQNNKTLTMRSKALQQLNQNSMNDRASILGSEASILRGYT